MKEPEREKELNKDKFGQVQFEYVNQMIEYYHSNNLTIDLRKFSSEEININPILYEIYLEQFKKEKMNEDLKEIYELTLLLQAKILDLKFKVKKAKDSIE